MKYKNNEEKTNEENDNKEKNKDKKSEKEEDNVTNEGPVIPENREPDGSEI